MCLRGKEQIINMSATEIFELRRNNLAKVIDQLIDSQQFQNGKEICEHFGLSAAYITQLLNSKRQIGEKVARELEQQLSLESLILIVLKHLSLKWHLIL